MDGEIDDEELSTLIDSGGDGVRIVDIRSKAAFRRGHIPGSINIPFGELTKRVEEVADANRIVTVCPHGQASVQAARLISSFEGFSGSVESFAPGIEGWNGELEVDEEAVASDTDSPF
ncbi:MAG: rhodanese-like domain-containing protein [Natronomonas sp.]